MQGHTEQPRVRLTRRTPGGYDGRLHTQLPCHRFQRLLRPDRGEEQLQNQGAVDRRRRFTTHLVRALRVPIHSFDRLPYRDIPVRKYVFLAFLFRYQFVEIFVIFLGNFFF